MPSSDEGAVIVLGANREHIPGDAIKVGSGAKMSYFDIIVATLTPVDVAAGSIAEQDFTISGIKLGDAIFINKPTIQLSPNLMMVNYRVKADDTISIAYRNDTGSPITPTAEDYTIVVFRKAT